MTGRKKKQKKRETVVNLSDLFYPRTKQRKRVVVGKLPLSFWTDGLPFKSKKEGMHFLRTTPMSINNERRLTTGRDYDNNKDLKTTLIDAIKNGNVEHMVTMMFYYRKDDYHGQAVPLMYEEIPYYPYTKTARQYRVKAIAI